MLHATKSRLGFAGLCDILAATKTPRTAAEIAERFGIYHDTVLRILRGMLTFGLVHRCEWVRPVPHSRMVPVWKLGKDSDIPMPKYEAKASRPPAPSLIALATVVQILREEPTSLSGLAQELAMDAESASRYIKELRRVKLARIAAWEKPPMGCSFALHTFGQGPDAQRPPRIPMDEQRKKHRTTYRAKKNHLRVIFAMTGTPAANEERQAA